MPQESVSANSRLYPQLVIERIQNPNRLWAIPILGFLVKIIIVIPISFWSLILWIAVLVVTFVINPFIVLFTGKYWNTAYSLNMGYIRLLTKVQFFLVGLTDKYPGFDLEIKDNWKLDMPMPTSPNRLFVIPLLGGLIRFVLLIPFFIWVAVVSYGATIGFIVSFAPVLFMKKYPETTFELYRDYTRISLASSLYFMGLSDTYPSFSISKNHLVAKIILIILGLSLYIIQALAQPPASYKNNPQTLPNYSAPITTY